MKKFALMIAALATIFIAAPSSNADAQTVIIKRGGHHHGYHHGTAPAPRCTIHRGYHRGRGHGHKGVVIKKRHRQLLRRDDNGPARGHFFVHASYTSWRSTS